MSLFTSQKPSFPYSISPALTPYQIPADRYTSNGFVGVVSAAIIIHKDRVLLIQRVGDDDYCPNLWEVPGGAANNDETPIDCVVRELWEETGLQASSVTAMLGEFEWDDTQVAPNGSSTRGKWKVFLFRVMVDAVDEDCLEVTLDPKEHQACLWATEREVRNDLCAGVKLEWISLNLKKTILADFQQDPPIQTN